MSLTLQIEKVSVIPTNKNKEVINVVAIRLANGTSIIRKYSQFLIDLRESHLIPEGVGMESGAVRKVLRQLKNGTVSGSLSFHKAGDVYIIDENHSALTNPNHRLYGKVVAGQEMTTEKDGWRITDGFLDFEPSAKAEEIQANADAYAEMRQRMLGAIAVPTVAATEEPVVEETFDIDEEELANAVVGAAEVE